jgi:hypothetical protein
MATNNAIRCGSITIANGQTNSNVIRADEVYQDAELLTLYAPAALDSTMFTIQITDDPDADTVVWNTLFDGVLNVTAPGAGLASTYPANNWVAFRIVAGSAVAAERIWRMTKTATYAGEQG